MTNKLAGGQRRLDFDALVGESDEMQLSPSTGRWARKEQARYDPHGEVGTNTNTHTNTHTDKIQMHVQIQIHQQ